MKIKIISLLFAVALLWTSGGQALCGEKTDRVIMQNGDHLTGEVKRLDVGILTFKTDDMGTISIEWEKIEQIESKETFEVEMQNGMLYYGSLGATTDSARTSVIRDSGTVELYRSEFARLVPIKGNFWARTSGTITLGTSYTKASEIGQLNVGINTDYKGPVYGGNLDFNAVITTQEGENSAQRYDFNVGGMRALGSRWYAAASLGFQRNTELGLDLRFQMTISALQNVVQTSSSRFTLGAGFAGNREWTEEYTSKVQNFELVTGAGYEAFRYDEPKLNLSTNIYVYTNLTNLGRVRSEFETILSWEIISDFTWALNLYDSFDNKPAAGGTQNDWGIVVSFGYSL